MHHSRYITKRYKTEVLLRCFFRCTTPGCDQLAADIHHVKEFSKGGANKPHNLVGLCKECHKNIHTKERRNDFVYIDWENRYVKLYEAPLHWLSYQIKTCPVRLDNTLRTNLFLEIEKAAKSEDHMAFHCEAVKNGNNWATYEIFLKASYEYLKGKKHLSNVFKMLLLKMTQFYRRRAGKISQQASLRYLKMLQQLLNDSDSKKFQWMKGTMLYEEAYLKYFNNQNIESLLNTLDSSALHEKINNRTIGKLISESRRFVVEVRKKNLSNAELLRRKNKFIDIQEQFDKFNNFLSKDWTFFSIPVHIAYIDLLLGNCGSVVEELKNSLNWSDQKETRWLLGIALIRSGDFQGGIEELKKSRKLSYKKNLSSERRAGVLVSLADACSIIGEFSESKKYYQEALRQPGNSDNSASIKIAKIRLANLKKKSPIKKQVEIYFC